MTAQTVHVTADLVDLLGVPLSREVRVSFRVPRGAGTYGGVIGAGDQTFLFPSRHKVTAADNWHLDVTVPKSDQGGNPITFSLIAEIETYTASGRVFLTCGPFEPTTDIDLSTVPDLVHGTTGVITVGGPKGDKGDPTTIVQGAGISVDDTDPANPIVSATFGGTYGELTGKPTIPSTPADIGAASAAALTAETNRASSAEGVNATAISAETTRATGAESALTTSVAGKVPTARTVNGHALSADVTVTKSDVGLGSADNTSDAGKPISAATATALAAKADLVAGTVPDAQIPDTGVAALVSASGSATHAALSATYATVVAHGSTAGTARPSGATQVLWKGTVSPTNGADGDVWLNTSTGDEQVRISGAFAFLNGTHNDASYAPVVDSPGSSTDVVPILQAALDNYQSVRLRPGKTYYWNSPLFLDSTDPGKHYRLQCEGATIVFGPNLATASGMADGLPGIKWAIFNNTLRSALSAGIVTTTSATTAAGTLTSYPRLVIDGSATWDANGNIVGIAFGNGAATHLSQFRFVNIQCGLAWVGYVDGNHLVDGQTSGSSPAGGVPTRLVYQRDSGDQTYVTRCKAYSGVLADLTGCQGFVIDGPIAGQIILNSCEGLIIAGHQETDELTNLPYSVTMDRTELTLIRSMNFVPKDTAKASIIINDSADAYYGSKLTLIEHSAVMYLRPSDSVDTPRGPLVNIAALNDNGKVVARGLRAYVKSGFDNSGVLRPEGPMIASSDSAIQAAIGAGAEQMTRDFELRKHSSGWVITAPDGATAAVRTYAVPSIGVAASTTVPGSLTGGQAYQYAAAIKTADGGYTALSSAVTMTATTGKACDLTLTSISGPCIVALWRVTGSTGVTTSPDHYIEIPCQGAATIWRDTGTRVNGRAWSTTSIPNPGTVGGAGAVSPGFMPTGALGQSFDRAALATASSGSLTSGTGVMALVQVVAGGWASTINWRSGSTAAASQTHAWACIKSRTGVVVGVTADLGSSAIAASTVQNWALTAPTYLAPGIYYVEVMVAASTMPNITVSSGGSATLAGLSPILTGNDPNSVGARTTPPAVGAVEAMPTSATAMMPYFWLA